MDEWLTDDVWSHIHTSHPHLHHQDTPSPPNDHFQTNPTVFPPSYSLVVTPATCDILLPRP